MNNFIVETYICMLDQVFQAQKVIYVSMTAVKIIGFLIKGFWGLFIMILVAYESQIFWVVFDPVANLSTSFEQEIRV